MINSCASLYVKEGFVTNAFQQQLKCADARMVALAGPRVGVVNACGAFYVKQGALSGPFNPQTGCNDTQAIAVAPNRIGVINGCGAGYVKDGAVTGPFSLATQLRRRPGVGRHRRQSRPSSTAAAAPT